MDSVETRALRWACGQHTGTSSKALLAVMCGAGKPSRHDFPRDDGDLGRCIRLLDAVPEWRSRINEMAEVGEEWAALAKHWELLTRLHVEGDSKGVYELIKKLTLPIRARDASVLRFGSEAELIFGDK